MCPSSINGIVGPQADGRPVEPRRHHPDLALAGLGGTDDPHGARRRDPARRAVCGVDPRDPATSASAGRFHTDYTTFLDPAGLKGARLGIVRNIPGFDERVAGALRSGHRRPAGRRRGDRRSREPAEHGLGQRLPGAADDRPELRVQGQHQPLLPEPGRRGAGEEPGRADPFNDAHRDQEMPFFGQERLIISEATSSLDATRVPQGGRDHSAPDPRRGHRRGHEPASPRRPGRRRPPGPAWLTDHIRGDRFDGGDSAGTAAIAGYPDITVPMGLVAGPAGGRLVLRPRLERADAPQDRLRLRAGHEAPAAADVPGHLGLSATASDGLTRTVRAMASPAARIY